MSTERTMKGSSVAGALLKEKENTAKPNGRIRRRSETPKRKGNIQKGEVLNPSGRPKGSKNKVTLLKEAVLASSEELVLHNWVKLVQKTIDLAEEGDTTALKILWDRVIPSKRAIDTTAEGKDNRSITINISGLEVKSVEDSTFDAEYEEIVNDG